MNKIKQNKKWKTERLQIFCCFVCFVCFVDVVLVVVMNLVQQNRPITDFIRNETTVFMLSLSLFLLCFCCCCCFPSVHLFYRDDSIHKFNNVAVGLVFFWFAFLPQKREKRHDNKTENNRATMTLNSSTLKIVFISPAVLPF